MTRLNYCKRRMWRNPGPTPYPHKPWTPEEIEEHEKQEAKRKEDMRLYQLGPKERGENSSRDRAISSLQGATTKWLL